MFMSILRGIGKLIKFSVKAITAILTLKSLRRGSSEKKPKSKVLAALAPAHPTKMGCVSRGFIAYGVVCIFALACALAWAYPLEAALSVLLSLTGYEQHGKIALLGKCFNARDPVMQSLNTTVQAGP